MKPSLFRQEAIAAQHKPEQFGELLNLLPAWTTPTYWFLVLSVVVAIGYCSVAAVSEYAAGPAVVRIDGRHDVITPTGGTLITVDVTQGQKVETGQVLARFYAGDEQNELKHLEREFDLTLVKVLLDPGDRASYQTVATLRAQREAMRSKIRERTVVAPISGIVANLRIRPGQSLSSGDVVLTLLDQDSTTFSVVAMIPGQYRPMLVPGMPLRLELEGYPHVYRFLDIESVGDEAVGPTELRRYLGAEVSDAISLTGTMTVVRAVLPDASFEFEGKDYPYYDGIPAKVDIRVKSTRIIVLLFPALRRIFDNEL